MSKELNLKELSGITGGTDNETAAASKVTYINYTIAKGDTLELIALKFNTTVNDIIRANDIQSNIGISSASNDSRLAPGRILKISLASKL